MAFAKKMFKEEASKILGISIYADLGQAKEARNNLLLKVHPDKVLEGLEGDKKKAEDLTRKINEAFEVFNRAEALVPISNSAFALKKVEEIWQIALNNWQEFENWFDNTIIEPIQHAGKRSNMIEMKFEILEFLKEGKSPNSRNIELFIGRKGIVNVHNIQMKAAIWQDILERFNASKIK